MGRKSYIDRIPSYGFKSAGAVANGHLWFQIKGYGFKANFYRKGGTSLRVRTAIQRRMTYISNGMFFTFCSRILRTIAPIIIEGANGEVDAPLSYLYLAKSL